MNELDFQGHLVKAATKDGHFALKCNNRFLVGVVDLSVKLIGFPHAYVECKKHNTLKGIQNTNITPHQRQFMKDYRKTGGVTGWVTFAPHKGHRDAYDIFTSVDIEAVRIDFNQPTELIYKPRGAPWPTYDIISQIIKKSGVECRKTYSSS